MLFAAGLVGLEVLGLLALAIAELINVNADRPALGYTNAAFFLAYAVGLGFAAWSLARLRAWSRGPVVLAQLLQLGVAWSFYGNDTVWLALLLAVVAVAVLAVMLAPATAKALYGERESDIT